MSCHILPYISDLIACYRSNHLIEYLKKNCEACLHIENVLNEDFVTGYLVLDDNTAIHTKVANILSEKVVQIDTIRYLLFIVICIIFFSRYYIDPTTLVWEAKPVEVVCGIKGRI